MEPESGKDEGDSMAQTEADTDKSTGTTLDSKHILTLLGIGAGILVLVLLVALLIPTEARQCALMPGFCKKKNTPPKGHFEQISDTATKPRFDLTSPQAFSLGR